jgi:4-aminobutyrate aminotransferase/(S)-3-amino-2-methylpropionate transaminase
MSDREDWIDRRVKNVPRGLYTFFPGFVQKADGAVVYDQKGKPYIDFIGGVGSVNVGHCPRDVVEAIEGQAKELIHISPHVMMYESYVELAERLNNLTPGDFPKKTYLCSTGAEAVENALKIARYHTCRDGILCFDHAYHGRTLLAMTLTSRIRPYKAGFGPLAPEVYRVPYAYCYRCAYALTYPQCDMACCDHIEEFFEIGCNPEDIAAWIAEPVLGEGGVVVPPPDYFKRIDELCRRHEILFVADEIQTGIGRTGTFFAMDYFGVEPDIVVMAKSLGGGLPLAAVTGRAEAMDAPMVGGLGCTFGGNPVSCRAALTVLETVEREDLCKRAAAIGRRVTEAMADWKGTFDIVGDVRGLGAMVGMELVKDRATKEPAKKEARFLVQECYRRGLILLYGGTHRNVIRTLIPLIIPDEQLNKGLRIIEEALVETGKKG